MHTTNHNIRASIATFIFTAVLALFPVAVFAATGIIDATNHYAWNDNGGYVNWLATSGNVVVTDTVLTGYIWSAGFGWINLSPDKGGVTNSGGVLGGYAWGANTGYINFAGVTIDSNGVFHGNTTAQSLFGTMNFDCTYCNVTTSWRGGSVTPTTGSGGGGGVISGPGSYNYPNQPATTTATTPVPLSLTPTTPPPTNSQPSSAPTSGTTPPAHLTPSITFTIYTAATAVVGKPLNVDIRFSNTKRTQDITYAYRLYRADSSIAFSQTGTLAPTGTSSLSVSIPTTGLAVGSYNVGMSAQYGKQAIASQTLSVKLYSTQAEASAHASDTTSAAHTAVCNWATCWWYKLVSSIASIWGAFMHLLGK